MMPEVRASSEVTARLRRRWARRVPIAGLQATSRLHYSAAMLLTDDQEYLRDRMLHAAEYGTRAVPSRNRLVTTVAWKIGDAMEYALEGSVFIGGAVVQWLRDGLG